MVFRKASTRVLKKTACLTLALAMLAGPWIIPPTKAINMSNDVANLVVSEIGTSGYSLKRMIEPQAKLYKTADGMNLEIYYFSKYNYYRSTGQLEESGIDNIQITRTAEYKNPENLQSAVVESGNAGGINYELRKINLKLASMTSKVYLWSESKGNVKGCIISIKDTINSEDTLENPDILFTAQTRIFPMNAEESNLPYVMNINGRKLSPYDSRELGKFMQSETKGINLRFRKPNFGVSKGEKLRFTLDGSEPNSNSMEAEHLSFRGYGLPTIYENVNIKPEDVKKYVGKNGGNLTLKVKYFDENNKAMLSTKSYTIPYGKRGVYKVENSYSEGGWFSSQTWNFSLTDSNSAIPYDSAINISNGNDNACSNAMYDIGISNYKAFDVQLREGDQSYKPLSRQSFPEYIQQLAVDGYSDANDIAVYTIQNSKAKLLPAMLTNAGLVKIDTNLSYAKYIIVPNGRSKAKQIALRDANNLKVQAQDILDGDAGLKDISYATKLRNGILSVDNKIEKINKKYDDYVFKLERANLELENSIRAFNEAPQLTVAELKDRLNIVIENADKEELYQSKSKTSVEALKAELARAKEIVKTSNDPSQIVEEIEALNTAIKNLVPAGKYYKVPLQALKEKNNKPSMAAGVFQNMAIVKNTDGKSRITIGLKEMKVGDKFAHLEKLFVYPNMSSNAEAKEANIDETMQAVGYDGVKAIFPKVISIDRDSTNEEYILVQVENDAMGTSRPFLRLRLDYANAQEVDGGQPYDNGGSNPQPQPGQDWKVEPILPEENEEVIKEVNVNLMQFDDDEEPSMASPAVVNQGQVVKRNGEYYVKLSFRETEIYCLPAYVKYVWYFENNNPTDQASKRSVRILDAYNANTPSVSGQMIKTFEIPLKDPNQRQVYAQFSVPSMGEYIPTAQYIFTDK